MNQVHHFGGAERFPNAGSSRPETGPVVIELIEMEQLAHRLSDMIERATAAVTRFKAHTATNPSGLNIADSASSARFIDQILRARARRLAIFGETVTDSAWDILLFVYWAHLHQQRVSVGNVCDGATVPLTTGLRWIDKLRSRNLIYVRADPLDQRRKFVELSPSGSECLQRYFSESPPAACVA